MIEPLLEAERALTVGALDRAERLYQGVADADPRNAIAVVGLARVAIERGDDHTAYGFARRALDIDPENPAAIGLESRLTEMIVARREPSPREAAGVPGRAQQEADRGLLSRLFRRGRA